MAILVEKDQKTLSGIYRDSYDTSYQQYQFDITKQSEELMSKVQFIKNLQCVYVDEKVGFNFECIFFGSDDEIFYIFGDFEIER